PDVDDIHGLDAQAVAARLQPLPHREYSIASAPGEHRLCLLLRRMLRPDGSPGVGSGWLCNHVAPGGRVDLRIRANPGFRGPDVDDIHGLDAQAVAARLQPLPHREYSIASAPGEHRLCLLLRRMLRPDGSPGVGSGWLCNHVAPGGRVDLRIRANPGFRGPDA